MIKNNNLLEHWIREALSERINDEPCKMLACIHKEGSRDVEVFSVQISPDKGYEPRELAELFRHKAESHVADIPGSQLFFIYAFYNDSGQPGQRRSFRVNNSDTDFGYGTTEPPTPQGGLMQAMRHGEAAFQLAFKQTQYILDIQFKMLAMQGNQISTLMKENHDALEIAKLTILERAKYESERMLESSKKQERLELLRMVPVLVNRILGREVFPQSTADTKILETLLSKLDETSLQKLAAFLPPEVMAMIAERGAAMHEERIRAVSIAERALTNGKVDDGKGESEGEDNIN